MLWNLLFAKQCKTLRRHIYRCLRLLIIIHFTSSGNRVHINKILLLLDQKTDFEQNIMRDSVDNVIRTMASRSGT